MPRRRWSFRMEAIDHRSILILDNLYRGRLTPAGRAVLWGTVASSTFLLGGLSSGLAQAFGFFWALSGVALLTVFQPRPKVQVQRLLSPPPSAHETWTYRVRVENRGTRPLYGLSVEERGLPAELRPVEEPPIIDVLEPGATALVSLRLHCRLRGEYQLNQLQVASAWPSGLLKVGKVITQPERVLVYPQFSPIEHIDLPMGKTHQPGGVPTAAKIGESAELHSLRAWREGDRLRDVCWPAFARTGKLIVREFQEEYFSRVALVVDLSAPKVADEIFVERALSMAAALTDVLARQDQIIDIFAAGVQVRRFSTGRALDHQAHVLELLACLEAGDRLDSAALTEALLPEASRLSTVFMVVTDWDKQRLHMLGTFRALGLCLRVICVRPGVVLEGLSVEEQLVLK